MPGEVIKFKINFELLRDSAPEFQEIHSALKDQTL